MNTPANRRAAATIAAVAAGVVSTAAAWDLLAAAVAAASTACALRSRRASCVLLWGAVGLAAAAHGAHARDTALSPPLVRWFDAHAGPDDRVAGVIDVDGVIVEDAVRVADGVRLSMLVRRLRVDRTWVEAIGRIQVHVAGELALGHLRDWTAGRRLTAPVALRRPPMSLNFGGASPLWQRLRRPYVLAAVVKSAALVDVRTGGPWAEAAAAIRWRVRDAAARFLAPRDPQAAAVVSAILIGDRAGLDAGVIESLQAAGTYHVIAISGGNVALLTAMCYLATGLFLRSSRLVAGVTLLVTVVYGSVVGGDASVTRAVVVACLYLTGTIAGLAPSPLATLRTAACGLVLLDPVIVTDVGAWLSFGATLGILVFARKMLDAGARNRLPAGLARLVRPAAALVAATAAAEVVLVPIAAAVFGRVTIAGFVLNLVAIPSMALIQVAGLVLSIAGPSWNLLGRSSALVVEYAVRALLGSSALTRHATWVAWNVPAVPIWLVGVYYWALLVLADAPRGRRRMMAAVVAAGAAGLVVSAPGIERMQPASGRLRVSMLDVGQGDAILVQLPDGESLLVDAGGSSPAFNGGRRIVTPAVWALGTRSLTWLAVTHGDRDHAGGAVGAAEALRPREVWEAVATAGDADRAELRRTAERDGIAWRTVLAGARVEAGGVVIETLSPPVPDWERPRVRNDDSIVFRLRYGRVELLMTGDAGVDVESALDGLGTLPIRILKVGHHGSRTSTGDTLLARFRPHVALISAGRGNAFGHPAPDVLRRLAACGAEVFRTDLEGAVMVETDGQSVRVTTALGRSWSLSSRGPI